MLVLSRKTGEKILLPSAGVTITITSMTGNRVYLGITAPVDVEIHREEVWKRRCAQQEEEQLQS